MSPNLSQPAEVGLKPVVVVPAFSRAKSLQRLLNALEVAHYPPGVTLVVSLDGEASQSVRRVVEGYRPSGLHVEVIEREKRLGLRDHLLACGDIALERGSVVVLEDDLMVDRHYYTYIARAIDYYAVDNAVSGTALYAPEYNEISRLRFSPVRNGYSTYLMQVPCSWGQGWTADQWNSFRSWYDGVDRRDITEDLRLPQQVREWPDSSWKKYFAGYLVATGRYFVYPYSSYSTNCSDAGGTHSPAGSDQFQVSLGLQERPTLQPAFTPTEGPGVAYDSYMEPCGSHVFKALGIPPSDVEIDLAGTKPLDLLKRKPLAVTSKRSTRAIKKFPLRFRPIEQNLHFAADMDHGRLVLTSTADIVEESRHNWTLAELGYHAGIPLATAQVGRAFLKELPRLALRKWRNRVWGV